MHKEARDVSSRLQNQAAPQALLPGVGLSSSLHVRGRRWGDMKGISGGSALKMLDVAPPQIPNLYSNLDLSPLFLLSCQECCS